MRLPPRALQPAAAAAARVGERVAGLECKRDRGRQGAGVLRAAVRRAAGGTRRPPPAAAAAGRSPARPGGARARVRGDRRVPGAAPRHLVEPQADGLERIQLVLPRQLDLLRPVDLRALRGGDDHAPVRGAAVRIGAAADPGRDLSRPGLDWDSHFVFPVGAARALRRGLWRAGVGVRPDARVAPAPGRARGGPRAPAVPSDATRASTA